MKFSVGRAFLEYTLFRYLGGLRHFLGRGCAHLTTDGFRQVFLAIEANTKPDAGQILRIVSAKSGVVPMDFSWGKMHNLGLFKAFFLFSHYINH